MPSVEPLAPLPDLPPIQHAGERVLTTELLARTYGVDPKNLHDNYQDNKDRFEAGVHFHRLEGDDLRAFKSYPATSGLADKFARHLILWTARGAAHHAKMINTDEAWAVYEKLASAYFDGRHEERISMPVAITPAPSLRLVAADFKALAGLGPLLGYDRNQAALAANRATRKFHGVDLLDDMGATHLIAPQQAPILTPTDIGKEFDNKSAMAINSLLKMHGFQVGKVDGKGRSYWVPTNVGEPFAVRQDTAKRHSDGTPVRQLKWAGTIVEALKSAIIEGGRD